MSKALLALMRDRSGSNGTVSRSTPQNTPPHPAAQRRNAILSVWPTLAIGAYLLMIAVGFLGDCAAQAGLISAACSFWAFWVFAGVALIFALVSELLERLKLIDKPNKAEPLFGDVFASRQPPPIDEEAPKADDGRPRALVIGGALPTSVSGPGRFASWRLEGDYKWWGQDEEAT